MVVQASVVELQASLTELIEYVLHLCDAILVMTVNAGFAGQKFLNHNPRTGVAQLVIRQHHLDRVVRFLFGHGHDHALAGG